MNSSNGRRFSSLKSMTAICVTFLASLNYGFAHEVEITEFQATVKSVDPDNPSHTAPDGFKVWELADINAGGIAQFQLPAQRVGGAIMHKTVSEIWLIVAGSGKVWINGVGEREISAGSYFIVPPQTPFQVRNDSTTEMTVIGLTMPHFHPEEVVEVEGPWSASADPASN